MDPTIELLVECQQLTAEIPHLPTLSCTTMSQLTLALTVANANTNANATSK